MGHSFKSLEYDESKSKNGGKLIPNGIKLEAMVAEHMKWHVFEKTNFFSLSATLNSSTLTKFTWK